MVENYPQAIQLIAKFTVESLQVSKINEMFVLCKLIITLMLNHVRCFFLFYDANFKIPLH